MCPKLKWLVPKRALSYCLFFAINVLLSACENISSSDTKPIFTIANLPVFKRDKINSFESDNQSQKVNETEILTVEIDAAPNQIKPTALEPPTLDTFKIAGSNLVKEEMAGKNQNDLETNQEENSQDDVTIDTVRLPQPKKPVEEIDDTTTSKTSEAKRRNDENEMVDPESAKSIKIASIIKFPNVNPQPPKVERIRLEAFINYSLVELETRMGKPNFVLRAEEISLWQYETGECIIDFFLKLNQTEYSVSFIDVRATRLGRKMDKYTCENELTNALNS